VDTVQEWLFELEVVSSAADDEAVSTPGAPPQPARATAAAATARLKDERVTARLFMRFLGSAESSAA
jgi:hypothetical protein